MLLDDIVAILSDNRGSLEDALLKTKVLLHEIGHKDLVSWVNNELGGYSDADQILPTGHLKEEHKKIIRETKVTSPIGTIEQQVAKYRATGQGLMRRLPPELIPNLQKGLAKGVNILKLWTEVNMADMEAIPLQVRSRLLDFCLELQGVVGRDVPPQQLQEKTRDVDTGKMFTTAIYNTGPGTIVLGNQNIQVNNQKDDIDGLLKEVAKLGYKTKVLEELRQAVADDASKGEIPSITDSQTGKWYTNALKKIGKGAVDVTVEVATGVIIKALEHFAKGG
jgi:hypothetical protein